MKAARVLARVGYALVAALGVLVTLLAAAALYLDTDGARRHLVTLGLRELGPVFPGGVHLGGSQGRLWHGVVLSDLEIDDLDGRPAVRVARVEVDYALLSLLIGRVQIDRLALDGVTIVERPLADGRDNLATLAALRRPLPRLPRALPVSVLLDALSVDVRYLRLDARMSPEHAPRDRQLRATLTAHASLSRGMLASLDDVRVALDAPARASLVLDGVVQVAARPTLRGVALRVRTDAASIRRLGAELPLEGPVTATVRADGPVDDLAAELALETRAPTIHLRAAAHAYADRVELRSLEARAPFASLEAHGRYRFDRTGAGAVHLDVRDLRALSRFGGPPLAGAARLDGRVELGAHLRAHATGSLRDLRAGDRRIGRARLELDTDDLAGHLFLDARRILLGGVQLDGVRLEARGDPHAFRLYAAARGPEGLDLDFAAEGTPRTAGRRWLGVDASLMSLRLRAGGTPWATARPAHASIDFASRSFSIEGLDLRNGGQRVRAGGRIAGGVIDHAKVEVAHFDLSQLPAVLSPGHVLPRTDVDVELDARGPLDSPDVGGRFTAEAYGHGRHDLIHITATGEGRWAARRLNGKVFATIGGQKTSAKVDMPLPLRPGQPLDLSFDANVLLSPWFANIIVPKMIQSQPIFLYSLGARVTLQGNVSGTTSDPQVHASARLARWGAANSHGELGLSIEYARRRLALSSKLELSELPEGGGHAAGVVEATADLPLDLTPALGGHGRFVDRDAPIHAQIAAHQLDVARLPFEAFAVVPFVRHGRVDGSVELAGTWAAPQARLHLDARGIDAGGLDGITVSGQAQLDGGAASADLRVAVRGADALRAHATLGEPGVVVRAWSQAPITGSFVVPGFDLARTDLFRGVDGNLDASGTIFGTWARPRVVGHARAVGLSSGDVRFRRCELEARIDDDGAAHAELGAEEERGGTLAARADASPSGALSGSLSATRFRVAFRSELLPRLRAVHAMLDGRVALSGTRARPSLRGALALSDGDLRLASTAVDFRMLAGRLAFDGDAITLRDLNVATGTGGSLDGDLRLGFGRGSAHALTGTLHLRRWPLTWETLTGEVDATLAIDGRRTPTGLAATARLSGARVELLDDRRLRGLIPLQRLDDLEAQTAHPAPSEGPRPPRAQPTQSPTLSIVGPFRVHGAELDAEGVSRLRVDFSTDVPTAQGSLALTGGTVHLYGRAYVLTHGALAFHGAVDPDLDLRMARETDGVRVGLELGGSAPQPSLRFFSDPPVYGAAEVARLVTGQRLEQGGVAKKGIADKVAGPLSSLIATSFRQTDPASPVVDVAHAVRSPRRLEIYEKVLPPASKK